MNERSTLIIGNSWHGRLYRWWDRAGGKHPNPDSRESLCHYVRVVVFWAPLRWSLMTAPRRLPWLCPLFMFGIVLFALESWLFRNSLLELLAIYALVGSILWALCNWISENVDRVVAWYERFSVGLALIAGIVVGAVFACWPGPSLLLLGGTVGLFAICTALIVGISLLYEWIEERRSGKTREHASAARVAIAYVAARKARICPYIEIVDLTQEPVS